MHKFDGVFYGQNVLVSGVIYIVEHGSQRGGLPRACRSGDQYQTAGHRRHVFEDLAHAEIFHGQNLGRDGSEHRTGATILIERVDPETCNTRYLKRKVGFEKFLVILALLVVHDVINQSVNFFMLHRGQVDATHVPVDTDHRRQAS